MSLEYTSSPGAMTRPTRPSDAERRARIVAAAERAFVRHGFHATTMQHVAEEAGMSAGNLYRYFPSKEAIVEGLCLVDQDERAGQFAALARSADLATAIGETLREHLLSRPPEKARLVVEIWAEAGRNPRIASITRALDANILSGLTALAAAAKASGAASPALDPAFRRARRVHARRGPLQAAGARAGVRRRGGTGDGDGTDEGAVRGRAHAGPELFRRRGLRMRRSLVLIAFFTALAGGRPVGRQDLRAVLEADGGAGESRPEGCRGMPGAGSRGGRCAARGRAARRHRRPRHERGNSSIVCSSRAPWSRARRRRSPRASTALTIVELDAEDGDRRRAGQVLARLDRTPARRAAGAERRGDRARRRARSSSRATLIAQAEAQVNWTSDDFDRARKLAGGVMSASTIEQRETALKTAQAQLAAAKNALTVAEADRKSRDAERRELLVRVGRTEVTAPVAGIVSRRSAKLGATASGSGEPLFRIIEDGAIDLEAEVPEQSLARLAVGMPAKLRLPGVADDVAGTVRLVNQEVDKASRTGKVRIALADVSHARIGAFASGEVDLARRDGVGVPASALSRDREGARILVVRDGRVEERRVTPGIVEGDSRGNSRRDRARAKSSSRAPRRSCRPGDRVRAVAQAAAPATSG